MKPTIIVSVALLLLLVAPFGAEAQSRKKAKANSTKTTVPRTSVRGAATVSELGQYVYAALQENNFEAIAQYFPTDTDITATGAKTPDEDLKLVLEGQTPETIQATFRSDFEDLQNRSIEQRLSFRDLKLMEVQPGAQQKANRMMPVHLLLTNSSNQTMAIVFETLKINGRFFLFQHIGTKSEAQ